MDYVKLLEESYLEESKLCGRSRLAYLGVNIFEFTTYDDAMDALFTEKAIEVCKAITERTTFEYIKDPENYKWYLLMCNMPFFNDKLNWGGSIRGAWWDLETFITESGGLWQGGKQIFKLVFSPDSNYKHIEWESFLRALDIFAAKDKAEKQLPIQQKGKEQ